MKYLAILVLCTISFISYANCGASDVSITSIYQYHDGTIFVNLDKTTDCSCSIPHRIAFNTNDKGYDFIKSMLLTAYATSKKIDVASNSDQCEIHGNTARLTYLFLKP